MTQDKPEEASISSNSHSTLRPDPEQRWIVLQDKLAANATWLARQGSLARKRGGGRRSWVVRFCTREDGRTVQRSLYVCSDDQPELLGRVRELLCRYRAASGWAREVASFARFAASAHAALKRGLLASPDHRQRRRG
jgi:hypothetical protein